jgi:hypothetical protein
MEQMRMGLEEAAEAAEAVLHRVELEALEHRVNYG